MKRYSRVVIVLMVLVLGMLSCQKSEYEQLVRSELEKGEIYTNYLWNLEVGDTKKEFYEKCWKLNAEKKISQGSGDKYALYYSEPEVGEDTLKKLKVEFFGIFDEEKIMTGVEMQIEFFAWAPWNKGYSAEDLLEFMKARYMRNLGGNDFITIPINDKTKAQVKIDGNRQILMYPKTKSKIKVMIEDLRTKNL